MFSFNRMKQLFRRNNKHPFHFRSDDGGEKHTRLEKTGIKHNSRRRELFRDPVTGYYWLSEYTVVVEPYDSDRQSTSGQ